MPVPQHRLTVYSQQNDLVPRRSRGNLYPQLGSLAPRGSAASLVGRMKLVPSGADRRGLFLLSAEHLEPEANHVPKSRIGPGHGAILRHTQPGAACKPADAPDWPIGRESP